MKRRGFLLGGAAAGAAAVLPRAAAAADVPPLLVTRAEDLQPAIFQQQQTGAMIELAAGVYGFNGPIVPTGQDGMPHQTVRIRGAGMRNTILRTLNVDNFTYTGLFGYNGPGLARPDPYLAPLHLTDCTLDGWAAGAGGQLPIRGGFGLVSLAEPYGSAYHEHTPRGPYHIFERVQFWRTPGYVFQPAKSVKLLGCEFQQVGQPWQDPNDPATIGYDNLGSGGNGHAVVIGCTWYDSAANYVDFEGSTGPGNPVSVIFQGNRSFNHIGGGLYGLGVGSIITGNRLENNLAVSGISYDGRTIERRGNIVANNVLRNIGLPPAKNPYGDIIKDNVQL